MKPLRKPSLRSWYGEDSEVKGWLGALAAVVLIAVVGIVVGGLAAGFGL